MAGEIDEMLWSNNLSKFVPHSFFGDQHSQFSPIHITSEMDNPNNAEFLFIINVLKLSVSDILNFDRTFILFNDDEPDAFKLAQKLWAELDDVNIERNYWTQTSDGWRQKSTM